MPASVAWASPAMPGSSSIRTVRVGRTFGSRNFWRTASPSAAQQQLGSLFPKLPTQVKLQLFLVAPDAVGNNARVMEVTLENHSACMAVFKESEMFDYWSLFRPYRTGLNKTPSQGV